MLVRDVDRLFQNYQYGEAGRQIYDFFWSEFADWYIEVSKLQLAQGGRRAEETARTLVSVLDASLRLLHPFTPFITEDLWGHLKAAAEGHFAASSQPQVEAEPGVLTFATSGWEDALIVARWPEPQPVEAWEAEAVADFSLVMEVVRAIRNLRAEKNVKPGRRIPAILVSVSAADVLRSQATTIAALAYLDEAGLRIESSLPGKPEGTIALVVGPVEIYLPLAGMVDVEEERTRLSKDLSDAESQIQRLEKLLSGSFAEKAPPPVVQKERDKLSAYQETAAKLRGQLEAL
jgi:valyl-tRNA synthetase